MATQDLTDWEDLQAQQQLALANTLRRQALSDPRADPLTAFAQGFGGSYMNNRALGSKQALDAARQAQTEQWMSQMPSSTTQTDVLNDEQAAALMQGDVAPTPRMVPKDYRTQARELQDWAGKGVNIRSPLAQALAQQGLVRAIAMPEKQAELEERTAARRADLEARNQQARELQAERLAEQRRQAEENRALRLTIAQMGASNRNQNADIQRELLEMKRDKLRAEKEAGPKLSTADAKAVSGAEDLIAKVTQARTLLEANKNAVGLKTLVPDLALQRVGTSGERMARAAIAELAAEKAHELYGAAFSASEQKRADKFIPRDGDSYETIMDKLKNLEAIANERVARIKGGGQAAPAPAAGDDALIDKYLPKGK